ncbi:M20/M25/M40 family metallo-hydrolase [Streptomyces sp. NPDC101160]|uniref:M20/M25/M40 family metallo-hydrolase n=1 Tax=Streptomyces sp. NPDC101160 TaxID=3366118 RepID=UPI003801A65B
MPRPVVVVSDPLPDDTLDLLRAACDVRRADGRDREELLAAVRDAAVLIVRSGTRVDREVLDRAPRLIGVVRAGVGLDNVDTEAARDAGVAVANTPGANAVSVAELTVGLAIALARRIPDAAQHVRQGEWDRAAFQGTELAGRTAGVLGLGRIGRQVARRLGAFDMTVLAHDPYVSDDECRSAGAEPVGLSQLLARADLLTVHLPRTPATEGLLGERELALVRPGLHLVNTSRGGILDEDALTRALKDGRVAAAALDVFAVEPPRESPLVGLPNVLPTPHLGAGTAQAQRRAGEEAVRIALEMVRAETPVSEGELPPPARTAPAPPASASAAPAPAIPAATVPAPTATPLDPARCADAVHALMPRLREELAELVALRSVAGDGPEPPADCERAARWVADAFGAEGFDVQLLRTDDGAATVLGRLPGPPGAREVVLYGHYDVVSEGDHDRWTTPPFTLTERDGRWYGRGAADCKGNVLMHLAAVRTLRRALPEGDPLPVSLTVLVEGAEERGRGSLERLLAERPELLAPDAVLVADSGNFEAGVPTLTTSLRGMAVAEVTVSTLRGDLHSGQFGGPVPDAMTALLRVLASLHDEHGDCAVPGLEPPAAPPSPAGHRQDRLRTDAEVAGYAEDRLRADASAPGSPEVRLRADAGAAGYPEARLSTDAEAAVYPEDRLRADAGVLDGVRLMGTGSAAQRLWARPAATVLAVDGPGPEEAVPALRATATALVSLRLPPGTDPARAHEALADHLRRAVPFGARLDIRRITTGASFRGRTDGPAHRAMSAAMAVAYGHEPLVIGAGGSIALCSTLQALHPDAEILLFGVEDPEARIHAPDESVNPGEIAATALAEALFLDRFAHN